MEESQQGDPLGALLPEEPVVGGHGLDSVLHNDLDYGVLALELVNVKGDLQHAIHAPREDHHLCVRVPGQPGLQRGPLEP